MVDEPGREGGDDRETAGTEEREPAEGDDREPTGGGDPGPVADGEPDVPGADEPADDESGAPAEGGDEPAEDVRPAEGDEPEGIGENEPGTAGDGEIAVGGPPGPDVPEPPTDEIPPDVRRYDRFQKIDRATYERVNEFLRERTYVTAREWAIARLCADFRTATGVEMTKIGENLPHLVPFMTDTYTPQAVNQARAAFEEKVHMAGATFLYGAMCGFFTADELDDVMYEVSEVAKFLLEVEGVELSVEEELDAEDRISSVMRDVRRASEGLRYEGVRCPECGHAFDPEGHGTHEAHEADAD